MFPIEKERSP